MADNTIDRLSLEVSSDASKAATGLDKLAKALNNVSSSIGGIDTNVFYNLSNALRDFNAQGLINVADAISKFGRKTATQATQNIPEITKTLSNLVREMNSIKRIKFDLSGLSSLVSSISKLGGKTATQAIPNIKNLGTAINQMLATLSKAPKVSKNLRVGGAY